MTTKSLTAERFIAKLRRRDATSGTRLHQALRDAEARFLRRESAWRCKLLADVVESERGPAVAMAQALGLEIDAQPEEAPPSDTDSDPPSSDETPSRPTLEEYDVPAGAREYVPGPAAQAARRGR